LIFKYVINIFFKAINIVNERIDAIDILLQKVSKKTENYFEKDLSQLKAIEMTPDDFYMIF
jgi:hypothetical protein